MKMNGIVDKVTQNHRRSPGRRANRRCPFVFRWRDSRYGGIVRLQVSLARWRPLTGRTRKKPPNRPATGSGALHLGSSLGRTWLKKASTAPIGTCHGTLLYQLEAYNGSRYRLRHPEVLTPYLSSFGSLHEGEITLPTARFRPRRISKRCRPRPCCCAGRDLVERPAAVADTLRERTAGAVPTARFDAGGGLQRRPPRRCAPLPAPVTCRWASRNSRRASASSCRAGAVVRSSPVAPRDALIGVDESLVDHPGHL